MANLIIKSSANDLVIQGSDESPAITVAAAGTTTFAEAATMSGTLGVTGNTTLSGTANALGTVTAGTLSHGTTLQGYVDSSNTGVTFPAGHIVQSKLASSGSTESTHNVSNQWDDTVITGSITPQYSDSNIMIQTTHTTYLYNLSGDGGYAYRWKRTIGGVADYPTHLTMLTGTNFHSQMYINPWGSRSEDVDVRSVLLIDENVGTTNAITYTMQAGLYLSNNMQCGGTYGGKWYLHLFEIKT